MKKVLPSLVILSFTGIFTMISACVSAGTFTSNVASGNWNDPLSWTAVGDGDGIPDTDDDVTIVTGHQITIVIVANTCRNLTVDAGGSIRGTNISRALNIYGDYTLNGSEVGSFTLGFRKLNGIVSGSGTPSQSAAWQFAANTTIDASMTVTKNVKCRIAWGKTVTNEGNFTLGPSGQMSPDAVSSTWINGTGGIVTLRSSLFMVGAIKNFSTFANSLVIRYTGNIPTVVSSQYSSVTINQNTTTLIADLTCLADLTINGTGTLTTGGFDLHVRGNFSQAATGTLTMSSGDVLVMEGTALQNMSTAAAVTITNLTIDNSAGVTATSGTYNITEVLTLDDGLLDVTAATAFTLTSDAVSTARLAPVVAGTISSNVTAQRYIDARADGYSDMASPMTDNTFADWDNELALLFTYNPPDEYPSCWSYSEALYDYIAVESSADPIQTAKGYEVFLDNDGSIATSFAATTINSIGTPQIGDVDISFTVSADIDGWNLVGNPYISFIDFATFQGSTSGTVGTNWMYYDEAIEDFVTTSGGEIASHQGFWIEVLSGSPTVIFQENQKTTSSGSSFRSTPDSYFGLRLASVDGSIKNTSNTYFRFDNNSTNNYEAGIDVTFKKVPAPEAPSLYSVTTEGKKLRINSTSEQNAMVYNLNYKTPVDGMYTISTNNIDFAFADGFTCIELEDKKTGIKTDLTSGDYQFNSSANDMESRFVLRLSKEGDCKKNTLTSVTNDDISILNKGNEGFLALFDMENDAQAVINVYNPLGQQLSPSQQVIVSQEQVRINVPVDYTGILTITIESGDKIISKRFYKQ